MYEMEGPRPVPPRTADSVARASAVRRDIRLADLASRSPGHRLRRGSRRATLVSRLPGRLVRRDVRPLPAAGRSLGRRVLRSAAVLGIQRVR